ncbi:MAG: MarR family winged helix-turn-helix transcriptional regulator [Actinomycetota bacterium]
MASPKQQLASDVWRSMFGFFMATRAQRDKVLGRLGLTGLSPNDAKALFSLQPGEGKPMGALAGEWVCDASNATWMVDRLEKHGFAERRPAPGDRRVKLVFLTPLGAKTRKKLMDGMFEPPPELLRLERDDLLALRRALEKLAPDED